MHTCTQFSKSKPPNNRDPIFEPKNEHKKTFLYREILPYNIENKEKQLENLEKITKNIYISLAANDFSKAAIFSKEINNWLNLKFDLPRQIRIKLVNVYYELCTTEGISPNNQRRFESLFLSLTKRHHYLSIHDISLDWKPAFLILKRIMFPNDEAFIESRAISNSNNISIIPIIKKARLYFLPKEIPNILNELLPLFNTSIISDAFIVIGMLNLFLPCHPSPNDDPKLDPQYWLPAIFHLWFLISNSNQCSSIFLDLLGRLAKESHPAPTRAPCLFTDNQLSYIFTTILRLFNIPIGNIKNPILNNIDLHEGIPFIQQKSFTKQAAKLIIYSISPLCLIKKKETKVLSKLKTLIKSIETYFHPSNHGPWTKNLSKFIYYLSNYFVDRWNKENDKELDILPEKKLNIGIRKEFVLTLRKVTFMIIYSQDYEVMEQSQITLQNLSYLEPSFILPCILRRIYPSMKGLIETHRTISSLQSLCILAPIISGTKIFKNHITSLLNLVLPYIDANDLDKAAYSLTFISRVAQNVPFHDLTENANYEIALNWIENELNKFENVINDDDDLLLESYNYNDTEVNNVDDNLIAKSSTAFFHEFIIIFLDRIFTLLKNLSDQTSTKTKSSENHIIEILPSTLTHFFASLSDNFFKLALEKIIHFISNNVLYQSIHSVNFLCSSCISKNPKLFFEKLFPILKTNILFEIENNEAASTRSTGNDIHPRDRALLWNLQILSTSINGTGNILISYGTDLEEILNILIEKSKGNIITHVGNFFSVILSNFTTIYPIDKEMFEDNTEKYQNIQPDYWAHKTDPKKLNIKWHIPSEDEITFSVNLFIYQSNKILKDLSYLMQTCTKSTFKTRKEWSDNVTKCVFYLKKGLFGIAFLFDSDFNEIKDENSQEDEGTGIMHKYPSGYFFEKRKDDPRYVQILQIKKEIGNTLHNLHAFLTKYHNDDIQCFKSLISTLKTWLLDVLYCRTANVLDNLIRSYTHDIQPYKISGLRKKYPRILLIKRAEIYHITRLKFNSRYRNMTSLDILLLEDLVCSCLNFYSEIRRCAQNTLNIALKIMTNSKNIIIPPLLNAMLSSDIEVLKGAIYSLSMLKHFKRVIMDNWDFILKYIHGLIYIMKFDILSLKKICNKAYVDFIITFKSHSKVTLYKKNFLNLIKPTDDVNIKVITLIKKVNEKHKYICNEIKKLRHKLIDIIKDTHWRTSAMIGTGLIKILVSVENPPDDKLVSSIIRESISEHPLLRLLYIESLTFFLSILWQHGLTNGNLKAILLEEVHLPTRILHHVSLNQQNVKIYTKKFLSDFSNPAKDHFIDTLQYGWLIWPKAYPIYLTKKESQFLQLNSFTKKTFDKTIHLFSETWFEQFFNHLKQESRQESPKFRVIIATFMKFLFQIIKNVPCHITLNNLKGKIEQLCIPENEKHEIRAGCEILSGLVSSLKCESLEYCNEVWEWMLPIVKKNFENITPETLIFWLNFVKFSFSKRDPRRSWPFLKMLISFRLDKKSDLAFKETAKIALLRKAITHCGWHFQFANLIIENLLFHLDHPYKRVRDEIGKTLYIITSSEYHESFCNAESFIEYQYQNQNSYMTIPYISSNHFKNVIKKIFSQLKDRKSEYILNSNSVSYISCSKTILSWLQYSLNKTEYTLIVPYIPETILPEIVFMLNIKEDHDLLSSTHQILQQIGDIYFPTHLLHSMTNSIIEIMISSENWHHKLNIFPLLQTFFF
ncbi:hypothetical protein PNEG_02995 [Pneumocystis murina B123]|uniref:Proteasome activator Blm10 mid region domain-containing protein n=1 Tax=Pneumocystis murina (strain B123) TaxID=1069680 RepID=M7NMQ4_PNEMU|nr:hypothetical protein PNEG_02995 [Pneumocystis murina B123]EMR08512.1 hypothetical protein PNEG_02995 [Pneumocystis murina B123]